MASSLSSTRLDHSRRLSARLVGVAAMEGSMIKQVVWTFAAGLTVLGSAQAAAADVQPDTSAASVAGVEPAATANAATSVALVASQEPAADEDRWNVTVTP